MTSKPTLTWHWPDVGPTPVSYGLDAEIFDSEKFPNAQTFVREAIQNSLDARLDACRPVRVKFAFHRDRLEQQSAFLADLQEKKTTSGLSWPEDWAQGEISWLTVQDFNSSGLLGDTTSRTSDFWNYWLNFGLSNKTGKGRGGRGIGRVTFLIASRINTVIGLTHRAHDGGIHACGMSVLKPVEIGEELKTAYAYLAKGPQKNIFELYHEDNFLLQLAEAFLIQGHLAEDATGLSLVIPYPHLDLDPSKLVAAAIENFAPAILNGMLVVEVNETKVDADSIDAEATNVAASFTSSAMKEDPTRLLNLARIAQSPTMSIEVERPTRLTKQVAAEDQEALRTTIESGESAVLSISIPVTREGTTTSSTIVAVMRRSESGRKPLDLFYREGMALPEVTARVPADLDLIVQANEGELATYLNFCEGKAHLDLLENRDVREKLREKGFSDGVSLKRFVRALMDDIRSLVLPDASKPDASVLSGFFSIVRKDMSEKKPGTGGGERGPPNPPDLPPDVPPPPPKLRPFIVSPLGDGFRVAANPNYTHFPTSFRLEVAYANGGRKPKWSPYDFQLEKMTLKDSSHAAKIRGNVVEASACGSDFLLEVTGFDTRRELVATLIERTSEDA